MAYMDIHQKKYKFVVCHFQKEQFCVKSKKEIKRVCPLLVEWYKGS